MHFFSFRNSFEKLSTDLGTLKLDEELSEDGMEEDAERLSQDWENVREGLMNAFNVVAAREIFK